MNRLRSIAQTTPMSIFVPTDLPLNRGLLDARSTGRTLSDLRRQFYPVEFFDVCSIIEEIVLRDEIVLVGKYGVLQRDYKAALQPFVDAGVFKLCLTSTKLLQATATDAHLRHAAQHAIRSGLTSSSLTDGDYAVTRLLGAEIDLRIPTIPLLQHLHNYQFFRRPVLDQTICDLVSRYEDLKTRAEYAKALDSKRLALRPVSVPPIALQVMQRVYSYDQIASMVLEVREEFSGLRAIMRSLAEAIADKRLSSPDYFKLVSTWEGRWRRISETIPGCSMHLGASAVPLLTGGVELANAYHKGSLSGALVAGAKLISSFAGLRGTMVLRPVHLSVRNYLQTHPQHMVAAVSRVFEEDPRSIRRKMEAVGSSSSTVWRQALARCR